MTTLALALAVCAATPPPVDEVVLSPAAGLERARTLSIRSTMTTDESILTFGEQEMVAGEGMVLTTELTAELADAYGPVEDGRTTRLVRRFGKVRTTSELEGGERGPGIVIEAPEDEVSSLEGRVVAFEWDAKEEAYGASFDDEEEGEQRWLDGLAQDLDLALLLPRGGVDVGDRWDLGPAAVGRLLRPAGQVMVRETVEHEHVPEGGIAITMADPRSIEQWDGLEGKVVVTYAGTEEAEGKRCAVFELEVDVDGVLGVGDALNEQNAERGMPEIDYDLADLERAVVGDGKLVWDLEHGVLASFELEVELDTALELHWLADMGGMELQVAMQQAHSGEVAVSLTSR